MLKKIVVFGGAGFLGSHVADALSQSGCAVTVFDQTVSPYLRPDQEMIVGNILNPAEIQAALQGADTVYHFAAVADIAAAKEEPRFAIEANLLGTLNILEGCRKQGIKRFIFASTIYVYSASGSFYRATKQACELFIEEYRKTYGLNFTVLRYGSLYGPRAGENNWIHRVIQQALQRHCIVRKGDGEEIREYIHVRDAARLSVRILSEDFVNQYVIITGQQMMRIKDVLLMVKEILGNQVELKFEPASDDEHYEITPYHFSPKVALKLTDNVSVDLGQGILELLDIEFHHNNREARYLPA
ncbi:MAG: NAD(P)-dependent oxidoreductase [Candidatus Omnitrophica bacterium]|nr:NAD(P)-dependent oxidoreductase [Candidatus Omnitrophota bacterium]